MLIHCMSELEDPVEFMQNWSPMYLPTAEIVVTLELVTGLGIALCVRGLAAR
jgi:hypothetical protein